MPSALPWFVVVLVGSIAGMSVVQFFARSLAEARTGIVPGIILGPRRAHQSHAADRV